jgi:transposase-like protein
MPNIKFNEQIAGKIVAAIRDGATQRGAAKMHGITPESLSIWKRKLPPFGEAIERARGEAQVLAEQSLLRLAARGNVNALMFFLRNRHPAEWGDTQRRELTVHQTLEDWVAASQKPSTNTEQTEADHD